MYLLPCLGQAVDFTKLTPLGYKSVKRLNINLMFLLIITFAV